MVACSMVDFVEIPEVDLRDGGPVRHARESPAVARALRDECVRSLPSMGARVLPAIDAITRRWLCHSHSEYIPEIRAIANELGVPGVWFLNGCYQWACTAVARDQNGAPWLARTLDWPFAGLGRHAAVARMLGPAGEFDSVTWPGYVGVLTASAPGRFAACANQGPMLRRTKQPWLRVLDVGLNGLRTAGCRFTPPDHLLRRVFETCRSYDDAKIQLENTPIARPVIYTLAGCRPGERCVIERTEQSSVTTLRDTAAANDWVRSRAKWEARVGPEVFFTRTFEEAAANSRARRDQLLFWRDKFDGSFSWLSPPVLNFFTRLAVEMCPGSGILRAAGCELDDARDLPVQVSASRPRLV